MNATFREEVKSSFATIHSKLEVVDSLNTRIGNLETQMTTLNKRLDTLIKVCTSATSLSSGSDWTHTSVSNNGESIHHNSASDVGNVIEIGSQDLTSSQLRTKKVIIMNQTPEKYHMTQGLGSPISTKTELDTLEEKITLPDMKDTVGYAYASDNRLHLNHFLNSFAASVNLNTLFDIMFTPLITKTVTIVMFKKTVLYSILKDEISTWTNVGPQLQEITLSASLNTNAT